MLIAPALANLRWPDFQALRAYGLNRKLARPRCELVLHCRSLAFSGFRAATLDLVPSYGCFHAGIWEERGIRRLGVRAQAEESNEREEARWIREEQRWLREDQRWQREEERWSAANKALHEENSTLKRELEELRDQVCQGQITDASLKNLVAGMRTLLQALALPSTEDPPSFERRKQIRSTVSLSGATEDAYIVEESEIQVTPGTFAASRDKIVAVVGPDVMESTSSSRKSPANQSFSPSDEAIGTSKASIPTTKKGRTLKSGMEGPDVKELQDALAELGFYSGEEDMEFSSFSSDTARAVKTWQSTYGVPEDGLVTVELMAALLAEVANSSKKEVGMKDSVGSNPKRPAKVEVPPEITNKKSSNAGTREVDRYERSDSQETGSGSLRRVYLLGENRWEEPDRLIRKKEESKSDNGASIGLKAGILRCFSCRGEGTMLCTECEGTGDLNVEEQFHEWCEEGAKCPYCEGSGAVDCDVCLGKGTQSQS